MGPQLSFSNSRVTKGLRDWLNYYFHISTQEGFNEEMLELHNNFLYLTRQEDNELPKMANTRQTGRVRQDQRNN